MTFTPYFTNSNIFNSCAICFPLSGGFATPANMQIPMHLTLLDVVTVNATTSNVMYGPVLDQVTNTGVGGQAVGYGISELPKLIIGGWIDTPCTKTAGLDPFYVSNVTDAWGNKITYAEIIAAYFEGRTQTFVGYGTTEAGDPYGGAAGTYWQRIDPLWFRDPMGRVYTSPRIFTFTATRVEAVPFRTSFNMTLQLMST